MSRVTVPLGQQCPSCGQVHTVCRGHKQRTTPGEDLKPCRQIKGTKGGYEWCGLHAGKSREEIDAEMRVRAVEGDARKALAYHGVRPVVDPVGELAKVASEIVALKDAFAARVNALDRKRSAATGSDDPDALSATLAAYERGLDRCIRVLKDLAGIDFDERRVRVDEATTRMLFGIIQSFLAEMRARTAAAESVAAADEAWEAWVAELLPPLLLEADQREAS